MNKTETRIYGCSDDLIEFEGQYSGEVGCYGTSESNKGVLLTCSDGTVLEAKYGKQDRAIWAIHIIKKGSCFKSFELCTDEDADPYSDVVILDGKIEWIYAATEWDKVE